MPLKIIDQFNSNFNLFISDSTNSNIISEERITNSSYSSVENNNSLVTSSESVSAKDLSIPKIDSAVTNLASTGKQKHIQWTGHSLIRGVLIQSCSAGAKNFTNDVFCHP